MTKKITQQHIADALQLSRNTVSKALNNEPGLKEDTRLRIIQHAIDMGYTKFPPGMLESITQLKHSRPEHAAHMGNRLIALLTHSDYVGNHYWSPFLRGLNTSLKEAGYTVAMSIVDMEEENELRLPPLFSQQTPAGIITIGSFLRAYYERIEHTGIPALFIDTYADFTMNLLKTDTLLVNNLDSVYRLTKSLLEQGCTDIGFVGDIGSCLSYWERWSGFQMALREFGVELDPALQIVNTLPRHYYYEAELREALGAMKQYPRAFVCANDAIAVELMNLMREEGKRVPEDIILTGFDNIGELAYVHPSIPTVDVPKEELGLRAGEQLIWRIAHPERPKELIRLNVQLKDAKHAK
ncbi:LacI family DNA-binding transcriptional regulator [Paenibacillus taiwanensis]|uniref:LacI family DNA-binding transcriptional regulator n=1 Tax=Paenibacillus taiwanensis TaxID=401638 RepID=UPI000428DBAB|nr:LacI family DNA-binding transcriptional regulator [Paenibacillus taiwanensis]